MKRVTLYSSSSSRRTRVGRPAEQRVTEPVGAERAESAASSASPTATSAGTRQTWRQRYRRFRVPIWTAVVATGVLVWVVANHRFFQTPHYMTREEAGAAMVEVLKTATLPSPAARAYAVIKPSIVRVRGMNLSGSAGDTPETSIGSGVVIVDKGLILTSLHVVAGADFISVTFDDGSESQATVVVREPERDIAVLWATTLPDNLVAATMRSTQDLVPGDQVIAVGFPFGIGPSVSAGVISGLHRQHRSISGEYMIEDLIQFDAAVNPGSSGGPLVTASGEVVGIVSSILNPGSSNTFAGIGFAVPIENAASAAGTSPF